MYLTTIIEVRDHGFEKEHMEGFGEKKGNGKIMV